mgnify:CR=1 FL=1
MKLEHVTLALVFFTSLLLGGCATTSYDRWVQKVKLVPTSQPPLPEGVSRKKPTDPPSLSQIGSEGEWEARNGMWVCVLSKKDTREVNLVPRSQPPLPQGVSRKKPTDPPSLSQIGCEGEWDARNGMWVGVPTPKIKYDSSRLPPCGGYTPPMGFFPFGVPFWGWGGSYGGGLGYAPYGGCRW